jgi:hypothetical protein
VIPELVAVAAIFALFAVLVWPVCWLVAVGFTLVAVTRAWEH